MELINSDRIEERKRNYQKVIDIDDFKRKRDEESIELRRKNRFNSVCKKRSLIQKNTKTQVFEFPKNSISRDLVDYDSSIISPDISHLERFVFLVKILNTSQDLKISKSALATLKKCLSQIHLEILQIILDQALSTKLIEFLTDQALQMDASLCLVNLSSGPSSMIQTLITDNIIEIIKEIVQQPISELTFNCIWILGNIAGDSVKNRDLLINEGVFPLLTSIFFKSQDLDSHNLSIFIWTIMNLCRGNPAPPNFMIEETLNIIIPSIKSSSDDVVSHCCWTLSFISGIDTLFINKLINSGILKIIIPLLSDKNIQNTVTPALRIIGNILTGTHAHSQFLINLGVISYLFRLLDLNSRPIKKETLWCMSNIVLGTEDQINAVLLHTDFVKVVNELRSVDFEIQKEAL